MRIRAYLRVVSDEATAHAIQEETAVPEASIRKTKAPIEGTNDKVWWNWGTTTVPIDTDNPDEGLKSLLAAHRHIFPILKKYRDQGAAIYLEMVTEYAEGEDARGLWLSAETIQLMNELGCDFDNDVVPLVCKES